VPILSLRAISDSVSKPFPIPPFVLFDVERQQTNFRRLTSHLIAHPNSVLGLLQFRARIVRVRKKLVNAIVDLVSVIE
jgi:hypothetical protein